VRNVSPEFTDVCVLGGGWAGLLAARELVRGPVSHGVKVLEQDSREDAGGLLKSIEIDGFTFDCGGPHILFSKYQETLDEIGGLLGTNQVKLPRRNFVYFEGQMVPYPFENGMYQLPAEARVRLGGGIIEAAITRASDPSWAPKSFHDWIYGFFGQHMGSEYLEPYNRKIWKRDLNAMSADWVFTPGRLPSPEIPDIARAIAGLESVGYREQAMFLYPKRGGIQSLYRSLLGLVEESGVSVEFGSPVRKLRRLPDGWEVNDTVRCKQIVSTIPLPSMAALLGSQLSTFDLPSALDYNRVLVVGVAMKGESPNQTAVFVPQPEVPFHRYTWMSYLNSPTHGGANLIAEVTIPRFEQCDVAQTSQAVVKGLVGIGVIPNDGSVLFVRSWLNEYGYPIYNHGHATVRDAVLSELRNLGIFSVGRWGSWHYWNTDMVLRAVRSTVANMDTTQSE